MANADRSFTIATLKVDGLDEMTAEGRREVAEWLRREAERISDPASHYKPKFTARYNTVPAVI